jgi:hypothetical protein
LSRIEKEAFSSTGLIEIVVPASVKVIGKSCFLDCVLLSSVKFESGSELSRIGGWAFGRTGLVEIYVPASVKVIGKKCFCRCYSLSSVTFESGSQLQKVETITLRKAGWFGKDARPNVGQVK